MLEYFRVGYIIYIIQIDLLKIPQSLRVRQVKTRTNIVLSVLPNDAYSMKRPLLLDVPIIRLANVGVSSSSLYV